MKETVVIPSKQEVKKLLTVAINDSGIHFESIGELLGLKWCDSLLPPIKGEPAWGYDGLVCFFNDHNIENSDSLKVALEKLQ